MFDAVVHRLVLGCSWRTVARLCGVSATTLRARRDEWVTAVVFIRLVDEALSAYDRVVARDTTEVSDDGSLHKAPAGGSGTGPSPVDRGKRGRKWSLACDRAGVPVGWTATGANRNGITELALTLAEVQARGLLAGLEVLHLDRGYWARSTFALADRLGCQLDMPRPARRGQGPRKVALGVRWKVERTNSWLSNFGQLRRSTDRHQVHRAAALDLAVALVVTVKLVDWTRRWNHR